MRGLNAPPRSSVAPADCAIRAAARVCSGVSTAHGPAISVSESGPIGTPRTCTTDRSGWCSRLTSLKPVEMRVTLPTPRMADRLSVANASTSPTRPMMTRLTPRLTNACPPAASTRSTTASTSDGCASGAITMTTVSS